MLSVSLVESSEDIDTVLNLLIFTTSVESFGGCNQSLGIKSPMGFVANLHPQLKLKCLICVVRYCLVRRQNISGTAGSATMPLTLNVPSRRETLTVIVIGFAGFANRV